MGCIMTERELRAVAEAIVAADREYMSCVMMAREENVADVEQFLIREDDAKRAAQAAISASDSKYVKGLVEALKSINIEIEDAVDRYNGTPLQRLQLVKKISYHALQTLPEDLR